MGAKKKGGLANRLARMSDEERAKYLQRKADMEEEARRRKEQLVANFMKGKLKKEDAFSRLNVAKINQQWHQILRTDKCRNMKKDVEHLRKWIDRIVNLKNQTINKLMNELDWQEGLYGKNFQAHSDHIDKIIGFHNKNLDQLRQQYEDDKILLLHIGSAERTEFENKAEEEVVYLKTIIHGQDVDQRKAEEETRETYMKKTDEMLSTYRNDLSQMRKAREKISSALWRQISKVITAYVHQTDLRRSHLAELRRLDADGAVAITKNQHHIVKEEEQLEKLKRQYSSLIEKHEGQIKGLENAVKLTTKRFFQMRKKLWSELTLDEQQLAHLTQVSNKTIEYLEKLAVKGEQILQMVQSCRKLETEDEKISRWTPVVEDLFDSEGQGSAVKNGDTLILEGKPNFLDSDERAKENYKPKFSSEDFSKPLEASSGSGSSYSENDLSHSGHSGHQTVPLTTPVVDKLEGASSIEDAIREVLINTTKDSIRASKAKPKTSLPKPPNRSLRQMKSDEAIGGSVTHEHETQVFHISTHLLRTTSKDKPRKLSEKPSTGRSTKITLVTTEEALIPVKLSLSTTTKPLKLRSASAPKDRARFDVVPPKSAPELLLDSSGAFISDFEELDKLEGLWWVYNKVEVDCMNMREEKRRLLLENNRLKGALRGILEATALGQSIPSAKSSSTSTSRKRFILSAPLSTFSLL